MEAHTEAGNKAFEQRGWRNCHLFDALKVEDRDLTEEPYRLRRDALMRSIAALANPKQLDGDKVVGKRWRVRSGRWSCGPRDFRRFPVVENARISRADELWDQARAGAIEGLVVIALDAPVGKRRSKLKAKPVATIEGVVRQVNAKTVLVQSFGCSFVVSRRSGIDAQQGAVVECSFEGRYGDGTPKFARLVRRRIDLEAA